MTNPENIYLDKIIAEPTLFAPLLLSLQTEADNYHPENFMNRYLILRDNKTHEIHILMQSHHNLGTISSKVQEHKDIRDQYLLDMGKTATDYTLIDAGYITFDFYNQDGRIHAKLKSESSTLHISPGMINPKDSLPHFKKWASSLENIVWEADQTYKSEAPITSLRDW